MQSSRLAHWLRRPDARPRVDAPVELDRIADAASARVAADCHSRIYNEADALNLQLEDDEQDGLLDAARQDEPCRMPKGLQRVKYDKTSGIHHFQEGDGTLWETKDGPEYGKALRLVDSADGPSYRDDDAHDEDVDLEAAAGRSDGYQPLAPDPGHVPHHRIVPQPAAYRRWFPLLTVITVGILLGLPYLLAHVFGDRPIKPGFPYGSQKVRGVNLGGWLVLEPWITPSLFDNTGNPNIVDEWTFCEMQNRTKATEALTHHWDTWITESDFAAIAAAGLNHVRIPIGYWAFETGPGEPYCSGQLPYLQKAVAWAESYGLKVIVDLHGAPGSQNGFDNSGQRMPVPGWHSNYTNVVRTNAVVKEIAAMFAGQEDVVPIIAPLNEPAGFHGQDVLEVVRQFWYDSYDSIRYPYGTAEQSDTVVLLHDAFQPLGYWKSFAEPPRWQGVAMDTHIYQMFSQEEVARSYAEHIAAACAHAPALASFELPVLVGEWTPAPTDCAPYLNGRGAGARYDASYPGHTYSGSCAGLTGRAEAFSESYKAFLAQYWAAQVRTYERGAGWVQWTWKAESADDWSYQAGLAHGWIPQDPAQVGYPDICG
ncbi:glycoside hydrolase family 5 protein [Phanerochaete sordida]|uniref:Glycoside hydrolase family 5 protein n=1 Tax=Phanerochaete sordida TaxID=48140 RepID=A0A9P3LA37_9APHY|nr:glycoside hydrolase family 5 protein [Phanerochaete sordida]